ncbi:hypothetical protein [Roseiconus lacunae]|uniref:Uncharacterized protein n=1 Tax=Roseiconus lacunae TaxID=2605694 RepID=A0ABT7PP69_9BACT|nr:hypothetical protein [Roseiconus lacunae]MCD0460195.1 hypothetical protein [Roseiconus lacunae]MDM4018294.1 hypothetical protein [Roseiconus lacunae]WRQ53618.1 hypothetical protein U8335_14085 [Stieleria sp. HD01]
MTFKMMKSLASMITLTLAVSVGCGGTESESENVVESAVGSTVDSAFVSDTEPAGAVPVGTARESVENDEQVTLVGKIGGSQQPFVDGLAAFTIVDPKVPHCSSDEGCPTPWDYCCTMNQVKDNIATVKMVDESGAPVASDAKSLLGVKELSTVVVTGSAKRDSEGNLTVAATKVFVRPGE